MCGGVSYYHDGKMRKVYFPQSDAQLPIKLKDVTKPDHLLPWGRREWEEGNLPATGWARLESLKAGKWDQYRPISAKIKVDQFMEKDKDGEPHWFGLNAGQFIQGAVVSWKGERRVYVVTIQPQGALAAIHDRWPRLVGPGAERSDLPGKIEQEIPG